MPASPTLPTVKCISTHTCACTHTPAADGMRQLAVVSEHEYLFTNNPLITSAGGGMKNPRLKQENIFRWSRVTPDAELQTMTFHGTNAHYESKANKTSEIEGTEFTAYLVHKCVWPRLQTSHTVILYVSYSIYTVPHGKCQEKSIHFSG